MNTLAIHSGALGDVVLFGHLLRAVGGEATLLAGGEKARLLAGLGVASRALDFDALPMHEAFAEIPEDRCRLSTLVGEHGRLVSCFGTDDLAAQSRLARISGATQSAFLRIRPTANADAHLVQLWCETLSLNFKPQPLAWQVPPAWLSGGDALRPRDSARQPYAVIHPGSGGRAKCWPLDRFIELARQIRSRLSLQPCFVIGPVELDQWGPAPARELANEFHLLQAPPLAMLAGLLAGASLYVGNDSGVAHLAAAVGTPTLAIFGPNSSPRHFAPLGRRVACVHQPSLDNVTVAQVLHASEQIRNGE